MPPLPLRPLPLILLATNVAFEVVAVILSLGREPLYDTLVYAAMFIIQAVTGALVASRRPRNPVGWLLLATALQGSLMASFAQGWMLRGWQGAEVAEMIPLTQWIIGGPLLCASFLLFPNGRFEHRWSPGVLGVGVVAAVVAVVSFVLSPDSGSYFVSRVNPYAIGGPWSALYVGALVPFLGAFVLSVVDLVLRFRRSDGIERQQLKWVALSASVAGVVLTVAVPFWNDYPIARIADAIVLTCIPVSMGLAILRYRLYDIDLVISRAVVYAGITVTLAATYGAVAVVIGTIGGQGSIWATAVVTLVAAFGARRLRDLLQRAVDRRFDREKYVALQRIQSFVDELRLGRAEPEEFQAVLREATGDPDLRLSFRLSGGYVDLAGGPVDVSDEDFLIRLGGATVGAISLGNGDEQVRARLPGLTEAGGLAVELARLRVELRQQLEEVAASRARIAVAADEERRRIERILHDGHQQRLVSIGLSLRHAQHALGDTAPRAHALINRAVDEISFAIAELREFARGLRPAQLDAGLTPALRELARRVPLPVEVVSATGRLHADVEAAAYFTACEGVTNAIKHSGASRIVVAASQEGNRLVLTVRDDGVGGAEPGSGSGLTGLRDRVAAHGGSLDLDSPAGRGTTLTAVFPCEL